MSEQPYSSPVASRPVQRSWLFPWRLHLFFALLAAPTALCWFHTGRTGLAGLYVFIALSNALLALAAHRAQSDASLPTPEPSP